MRKRYFIFLLCFVCWAPALALAQTGSITGIVTDPTGAAVPGGIVTATNGATNTSLLAHTDKTGNYVISQVPIGTYSVTVTKTGFQTLEQSQIVVSVDQTVRVDVKLRVGTTRQTVTVSGGAPLLQTEKADVGTVVSNKEFLELPLTLGGGIRDPSSFIMLNPGVTPNATWEKHIGGGFSFSDQTYYDGIALARGDLSNDAEVNPSVDAIAEFKLVENNYSAEYTHALSGVTLFTMKSGTNQFHGDAYEFNSIEKYNARNFFQPTRPPYKQNEWGFTIGGPFVIPKIYNGHNKTFFFFSYDQFYVRSPGSPGLGTVPTAAMLNGDFSQWVAAGHGQIYDPATTRTGANGSVVRDPFPGNVIPQSRWSAVSKNLVGLYPQPTYPGLVNNYQLVTGGPYSNQRTLGFRLDHQFNEKHRVSGMFNRTNRPSAKCPGANNVGGNGMAGPLACLNIQNVMADIARLNYDWVLSPSLLNHFAAGFNEFRNPNFNANYGQGWPQKIGLTGVVGSMMPWVDFNHDYIRISDTIASNNVFTNFDVQDTLSWVHANHELKVGFELMHWRNNFHNFGTTSGNFQFNQLETGLPGVSNTGNAFASFLLGDVHSGSALFPGLQSGNRNSYYSPWFNDNWKVTPRLTLNIGLRWEVQPPFSDSHNRISWMDPTLPNPALGGYLGAYAFEGTGPGRSGMNSVGNTHWGGTDFAPRFGIAYRFMKNTVVRGGFGMFNAQNLGVPAPSDGANVSASFSSGNNGITPAFNWDTGFPQNFEHPPIVDPTVDNGLGATLLDPNRSTLIPYTMQYNLMVERQIGSTTSISVGYVAQLGRRIESGWNFGEVSPSYLKLGSLLTDNINNPAVVAAGFRPPFPQFSQLWGARATLAQALRLFPQYSGVSFGGANFGLSSYNSLQVQAVKHTGHGVDFTVAYTFSKFISNVPGDTSEAGPMDYWNRQLDRSVDGIDQPQILTFSYIYHIPVGSQQRFHIKGPLDWVIGGWTVSGIQSYSSGFPINVTMNNNLPIFNPGQRPNVVSSQFKGWSGSSFDPSKDLWLSSAAFAAPAPNTFGDAPRYINYRGPKQLSESLALLKDFHWKERLDVQFRAEASNPFNRVVFGSPVSNFSSGSFGSIGSAGGAREIQFGLKLYF